MTSEQLVDPSLLYQAVTHIASQLSLFNFKFMEMDEINEAPPNPSNDGNTVMQNAVTGTLI